MKLCLSVALGFIFLTSASLAGLAQGKSPRAGYVIVPGTNIEHPWDIGVRAHTNYLIFVPAAKPTAPGPQGETPGSLACIYHLVLSRPAGCPIGSATTLPSGGSGVIAIVDAYYYPTASADFNTFSDEFHLPSGSTCASSKPCFAQVFATGVQPKTNAGWALEQALDMEWAHAMAPDAQIVLVEAASSSLTDLLTAVGVASNYVVCGAASCPSGGNGKGEVSMSWGGSEFSGETSLDSDFTTANVVYAAASGDSGGTVIWPSASPNVVSSGGTTINRDLSGDFTSETAWGDSGGGDSAYELVPGYQSSVKSVSALVGKFRGTPDFSFDANPASGVSVYDSTPYHGQSGWLVVGGTSVSAQALAGIINLAGSFASSTDSELTTIYNAYNSTSYSSDFTDITTGQTSGCKGHHVTSTCFHALTGWDFMTGVGSDRGTSGK